LISGCGKVAVRTEIIKQYPPEVLLAPITEPVAPVIKPGELNVGDLVNWYEAWLESYRRAFKSAEADKAAIREWVKGVQ